MAIYDLFLSRNNAASTPQNYVGHTGRLFYNSATGGLRISDGVTAGGLPMPLNNASTSTVGGIKIGDGFTISPDGTLSLNAGNMFELNEVDVFVLKAATNTQIGGVKLGPGVTVNGDGQIIIDSGGLEFSFGDFASTVGTYTNATSYAVLSTINDDEDMVLASNGTGGIQVVGEFRVHATNGALTDTLESNPIFEVKADGQVKILVPLIDSTAGAVSIVGSSTGEFIAPLNTGVMLHVTGNLASPGIPSRIYNDSQNAFAAFVGRRFNGSVSTATAVLADEELMRITATAHNGTQFPTAAGQRISYRALGNQSLSNGGGAIEFWTTPLNTTTIAKVATVDSVGITLESGKVLTGNVTGNVSGTAATVTTAAQPAITSVGTLTNVTVANLVTAKNYSGQARNAGTLGAGGTLTIDFATDHNVLVNLTTTAVIAFSNITAGKTVTVLLKNDTGLNRTITTGVSDINCSGGDATPNVNDQRTGVLVYRSFGTTAADVYCEVNP